MNTIVVTKKQATELLKGLKEINIVMLSSKESIITDTRICKTKEPIGDLQELSITIEHDNRAKNIKSILSKGFTLTLVDGQWQIDKELNIRTKKEHEFFTENFKGELNHKLEFSKEDFEFIKKIAKAPLECQKALTFVEDKEGVRAYGYNEYEEEDFETILETSKISSGTRISINTQYIVEMLDDKDEKTLYYEYNAELEKVQKPIKSGNDYVISYYGIEYRNKLESNWTPRSEQEEAEWQQTKAELEQQKQEVKEFWKKKKRIEKFYKRKDKLDDLTRYVALHNVVGEPTYYNKWNEFATTASELEKSCMIDDIKSETKFFLRDYQYNLETQHLANYEEYYKFLELDSKLSLEDNARLMNYLEHLEDNANVCTLKEIARQMPSAKTTETKIDLESFGISGTIEGTIIDYDNKQRLLECELFYSLEGKEKCLIAESEMIRNLQDFIDKEILYCKEHSSLLDCVANYLIANYVDTDRVLQLEYSYDILEYLTEDYNEGECDLDKLVDKEHDNLHIDYGYADLRVYSLTNKDLEKVDWDLLYSYQNEFDSQIRNLLYDKEFLGEYAGKVGIFSRKQKDIFVYERWELLEETKDIDKLIARHKVPKEILQKVADKIKEIATMYVEYSLEYEEEYEQ